MKIYIITSGSDTEDYSIIGVVDTKEKANGVVDLYTRSCACTTNIEEYDTDDIRLFSEKDVAYKVTMHPIDGAFISIEHTRNISNDTVRDSKNMLICSTGAIYSVITDKGLDAAVQMAKDKFLEYQNQEKKKPKARR